MDACGPEALRPAPAPSLLQSRAGLDPRVPLDFALPPLPAGGVACVGLRIDWQRQQALREHALGLTAPDEHAHAARFLRPQDALRHLLGRALLRRVASHYGGPQPLRALAVDAFGRPRFEGAAFDCNLTHSGDEVWVALAFGRRVGIDIEALDAVADLEVVLPGLHPQEAAAIAASPAATTAALRCWCRKEAVAKATGLGLSLPLQDYAVDCSAVPAGWLRVPPPGSTPSDWTTIDLPAPAGYAGALAVLGCCAQVNVLRLAPPEGS